MMRIILKLSFLGNQSAKHLRQGTKCAFYFVLQVPPGSMHQIRCRLYRKDEEPCQLFGKTFDDIINQRLREADEFYSSVWHIVLLQ